MNCRRDLATALAVQAMLILLLAKYKLLVKHKRC